MPNHGRELPHDRWPAPTAKRRRFQPADRRSSDGLGENADRSFVSGRLGEEDKPHSVVGTPPSTPVYHASPNWASWRTRSRSDLRASGSNLAALPLFSAITMSSRWSRNKSTM